MGVYINMEMPTSPVLFCIHPDGKVFADLEGGWREYQAVPVPEHRRLIDADELKTAFPCGESVRTECVRDTIDHAPTIIPEDEVV